MKIYFKKTISILILVNFVLTQVGIIYAQEASSSAQQPSGVVIASPTSVPIATSSAQLTPTKTEILPEPVISKPKDVISQENNIDLNTNVLKNLTRNQNAQSAFQKQPAKIKKLNQTDYAVSDSITVSVDNPQDLKLQAEVVDATGLHVDVKISQIESIGKTLVTIEPPETKLTPGQYTLKITDGYGTSSKQDFTWGVLAINTNKSIYVAGENVNFAMAVLDDKGAMDCSAKVDLTVSNISHSINETFSTTDGSIKVGQNCSLYEYSLEPDFSAEYISNEVGVYNLKLSAETKNGTYTITDSFEVREELHFEVERVAPTRIYPPLTYPANFIIKANRDFKGQIIETIPNDFSASPSASLDFKSYDQLISGAPVTMNSQAIDSAIYNISYPFIGKPNVSLKFGQKPDDTNILKKYVDSGVSGHDGIDFDMPKGTDILSVDDGEVVLAKKNDDYGTTLVISHSWGKSYYGHLSQLLAKEGQKVVKGEKVALSGSTGLSTGSHLHFGIKPNKTDQNNGFYGKINPQPILDHAENKTLAKQNNVSTLTKQLIWNVDIKKGQEIKLGYLFKAPEVSPQFYKLGPLKFTNSGGETVFYEARQWQIAVDAIDSISTTTRNTATSANTQRKITRTADGTIHAITNTGGITMTCGGSSLGGLLYTTSTDEGATWTCQSQLHSAGTAHAALASDTSDNLYVAYGVISNGGNAANDIFYRKISKNDLTCTSACAWTVNAQQTALDSTLSTTSYSYVSIEYESTSRLWLIFRYVDTAVGYQTKVAYSDSNGTAPTWTTSTATFETADTSTNYHYPTSIKFGTKLAVLYSTGNDVNWRYRDDADAVDTWAGADAVVIDGTTGNVSDKLSVTKDSSNNLHAIGHLNALVSSPGAITYSYYNGTSWSTNVSIASTTLATSGNSYPQITTDGTNVYVIWQNNVGVANNLDVYRLVYKKGVSPFTSTEFDSTYSEINSNDRFFDAVWVNDIDAATPFEDETATASNSTTTGDMTHLTSGGMVQAVGDEIYFGMSEKFRGVSLSITQGAGGVVAWKYCSAATGSTCTTWTTITTIGTTNPNLTGCTGSGSNVACGIWFEPPAGWLPVKISTDANDLYYLKAEVTTLYTTVPIGVQARPFLKTLVPTVQRGDATTRTLYLAWTEFLNSVSTNDVTRFNNFSILPYQANQMRHGKWFGDLGTEKPFTF